MPQITNLNTFPYFDDFDRSKSFYKVLFKPGQPVQARELTTIQSILQNQIEEFGNHTFKEGSVVIPGTLKVIDQAYNLQLEENYNGIDVSQYLNSLVGKIIVGQDTGIRAKVEVVSGYNIFVNVVSSGNDNQTKLFNAGEDLAIEEALNLTDAQITTFNAGDTIATVRQNSNGCLAKLSEGVFYLRGFFVNVSDQTLVISTEDSNPTFNLGFQVTETFVDAYDDVSLYDNSQGFVNYAATGADRLKIEASLIHVETGEETPQDFVELAKIKNGIIESSKIDNPEYNVLADEFARRTFDESGDYYVKPFSLELKNSLNDYKGNNGVYESNELTSSGNSPSDDLGVYKLSSGKAYVRGYEVDIPSNLFIDFKKPRETKEFKSQAISYLTGSTLSLNRVYGAPKIGFSTSYTVSLRDERVGASSTVASGKEIGLARVYDFALESGSYDVSNSNLNTWDLSLFDVQPFTDIIVNENIQSVQTPTFIKGKSSGAVGFLRYDVSNSGILTAYNVRGNFIKGEELVFDGNDSDRIATSVTSYGISNVKSIFGEIGVTTFSGDVKQSTILELGPCTIDSFGFVTQADRDFTKNFKVGDLVRYNQASQSLPNISRVVSVASTSIGLEAVQSVSGICVGALPSSQIDLIDVNKVATILQASEDNTLYTPLPKTNISDVKLLDSSITIRRSFNTTITSDPTGGRITILPQDLNTGETFLPFDEERYIVTNKDGGTEILTSDKFTITSGGRELIIKGLSTTGSATLVATLKKASIKSITKTKNKVKTVIVNKSNLEGSGIGATTLNDGLSYGNYPYGTRIQDDDICLLDPDVTKLYAVYESSTIGDPSLPRLVVSNISSLNSSVNDALDGEEIFGETSNAIGILVTKVSSTVAEIVPLNDKKFVSGETLTFKESGITATADSLTEGDNNIIGRYTLNKGLRNTIYDYSRISRKPNTESPTKRILVVYEQASIDSTDTGSLLDVSSYQKFDYNDISSTNGYRHSDLIDIRPRVKPYAVAEGSRSPFEFLGRSFETTQNNNIDILASDEDIKLDYSIYLPRIDRIYLTKQKTVQILNGVSAENPEPPLPINDALEIGVVSLPAYLRSTSDAKINLISHKRYQMRDIAKLEDRIKNLEYYTSLSLLETNTANLEIKDSQGNDRFKSGFFVDNFTTTNNQIKVGPKNSIDPNNNEMRASSYTTELDMLLGSTALTGVQGPFDADADPVYVNDLIGNNVRRSTLNLYGSDDNQGMGLLTLDYTETLLTSQQNATRIANAAPYFVTFYTGVITLNPSSDVWIEQSRIETQTVEGLIGGYNVTNVEATPDDLDPQAGWSPILWGGWNEEWTGRTIRDRTLQSSDTSSSPATNLRTRGSATVDTSITVRETTRSGTATQAGLSSRVQTVPGNRISLGDKIASLNVTSFMRSRNLEVSSKELKPNTQLYAFFDSVPVTKYCVPKLIEIEMISGTFSEGELIGGGTIKPSINGDAPYIRFRSAQINHRTGPFKNPTDTYKTNPYTSEEMATSYSTSSTILNVDTASLSIQTQGQYYGYIETGMILEGRTSGARARVKNLRLISDETGSLVASFYIPNPNAPTTPKFRSGESTFKLIDTSSLNLPDGIQTTGAEKTFFSSGNIAQVQGTVISTRNVEVTNAFTSQSRNISETSESVIDLNTNVDLTVPDITLPEELLELPGRVDNLEDAVDDLGNRLDEQGNRIDALARRDRAIQNELNRQRVAIQNARRVTNITNVTNVTQNVTNVTRVTNVTNVRNVTNRITNVTPRRRDDDPLAQSFFVGSAEDSTGAFITGVDLYFQSAGVDETCFVELRPMVNGLPSSTEIYPLSHVVLKDTDVKVSDDASVATNVTFPAPVYLEGNKEHCIVIGSNTTGFNLWISRLGEVDVANLALPESEQVPITKQSDLGSLFKSQNSSTWTPSQYEDLKFDLYRANFVEEGTISFFNPDLNNGNSHIPVLKKDSLDVGSRRIIVGLGTTAVGWGTEIVPGNTVTQDDSNATGNYVMGLGIATGTMSIVNAGLGLTPSAGTYQYDGVTLESLTGRGENATANIFVENGVAIGATILSGGNGFKVGDIVTASVGDGIGRNLQLSVSEIFGINELILDQVQGDFNVGSGKTLRYINSSGITSEFSNNASVTLDSSPRVITDGLHIKVNHLNHGMHALTNNVIVGDVVSDLQPVKLSSDYSRTSTEDIVISDSSIFATFEGVGVGTTNPGYIQLGDEIISYEGVVGNTLTDITRGIDSTFVGSYETDNLVYKYENSGVSLRRINKEHQLQDATVSDAIGLDHYTIKIDNSSDGVDRSNSSSLPTLYLNQTKSTGGSNITATQNIQYEIMKPMIQHMILQKTGIDARARTLTATSVNGNEVSFEDAGYSSISLDSDNYFDTPRLIASKVNSDNLLTNLPGNKSLEIEINMRSYDPRVSPVIDLDRTGIIFVSNRVNSVISDYANDQRTSTLKNDPSAFIYATKPIGLEIPANNLRVVLAAYINNFADIRAFYAITNEPSEELIYYPFPGYNNLQEDGQIIDPNDNDGRSDSFVSPTDNKGFESTALTFKDYEFTIEDLPSFKYFSIKLVATSTNQCYPPRIRDLRTIAFA